MVKRDERPESEVFGTEEALARISMELLNPQDQKLLTVTDVTPEEIFGLSTLMEYAKKFKSTIIKDWVRNFLLMRISRFRLGRREFLLLGTGMKESMEERRRGKKVTDLFAGLK